LHLLSISPLFLLRPGAALPRFALHGRLAWPAQAGGFKAARFGFLLVELALSLAAADGLACGLLTVHWVNFIERFKIWPRQ